MSDARRALILGPGGVVGTAWTAGLATGLRGRGVDLAAADLIIGTSAGAIVGAMVTTGRDLAELATPPDGGPPAPRTDFALLGEVFTVLGDPDLDPVTARRRAGRIALTADTGAERDHLARIGVLVGAEQWPEHRLLVTAVDAETGDRRVWDRAGDAALVPAVASSCAVPGVFPPITVGGRRYMDGGIGFGLNADLAAGARDVVVVEPLAHLFAPEPVERQTGAERLVRVRPDEAAVAAMGMDPLDRTTWAAAYEAGARQAAEAAGAIGSVWDGG